MTQGCRLSPMERQEEQNEKIGDKLFVYEREREREWELEKLKVWKLGKRKWKNIKKIGNLENRKWENIKKIGNMENL